MLNILSLKKKQANSAAKTSKKTTSAEIRIQKDLEELDSLPSSINVEFPKPDDLFLFNLKIIPDEGNLSQSNLLLSNLIYLSNLLQSNLLP